MKRSVSLFLAILMLAALLLFPLSCDSDPATGDENKPVGLVLQNSYREKLPAAEGTTLFVQFEMSDGSTFVVELYPEYAPATVANFQSLVSTGFYNGLTFHRIYAGFVIQGGDPEGTGYGHSGTRIEGEFAENGFTQNTLKHERGVLSMARGTDPNTASCQFFIMHANNSNLDGKYAAFGRVIRGMETVDAIATLPVTWNSLQTEKTKPTIPPVIKEAIFVEAPAEVTE